MATTTPLRCPPFRSCPWATLPWWTWPWPTTWVACVQSTWCPSARPPMDWTSPGQCPWSCFAGITAQHYRSQFPFSWVSQPLLIFEAHPAVILIKAFCCLCISGFSHVCVCVRRTKDRIEPEHIREKDGSAMPKPLNLEVHKPPNGHLDKEPPGMPLEDWFIDWLVSHLMDGWSFSTASSPPELDVSPLHGYKWPQVPHAGIHQQQQWCWWWGWWIWLIWCIWWWRFSHERCVVLVSSMLLMFMICWGVLGE